MIAEQKIKTIKFISLLAFAAFLATNLITATSYGEKSILTDLSTFQLAGCSMISIIIPIALFSKKGNLKVFEWLVWIALAIGFAFLAMDDKFMVHERIDKAIHAAFQWRETKISDRIDDIIVGIYGVIGMIFIISNRKHFRFSPRFINYAKYALALAFVMVLCDMKGIYGLNQNINQILSHLEEWTKIFGGGFIFIGLLCALEDALHSHPKDDNRQIP